MSIRWISFKKAQLDEEERYLNKKLEMGLVLKKRGSLFYHFNKVPVDSLNDLAVRVVYKNKNRTRKNFSLSKNVTVLFENKAIFSDGKVLYLLANKNLELLSDQSSLLKWYQKSEGRYLNYGNLFGIATAMIFVLSLTSFKIPTFFYLMFPFLALLTMFNFLKASSYFVGSKQILHKMGKLTGFEPEYILDFSEPIDQITETKLASIGYLKQVNSTVFKIKVSMKETELRQYIMKIADLKATDFSIAQLGEMYVLF